MTELDSVGRRRKKAVNSILYNKCRPMDFRKKGDHWNEKLKQTSVNTYS